MAVTIHVGDALAVLRTLESESVQLVCTSPPYFALRDYGTATWQGGDNGHEHRGTRPCTAPAGTVKQASNAGSVDVWAGDCSCGATRIDQQLGLEPTPAEFIAALVEVFDEVRRVLRPDGLCFVNIGDSYSGSGKGPTGSNGIQNAETRQGFESGYWSTCRCLNQKRLPDDSTCIWCNGDGRILRKGGRKSKTEGTAGIPAKNLLLIPQRFAIAMQDAGWWVRSEIVWAKTSAMPESVRDRPTRSWEPIFMFSKSPRYFYDQEAVRGIGRDEALQRMPRMAASQQLFPEERQGEPSCSSLQAMQPEAREETQVNGLASGIPESVSPLGQSQRGTVEILRDPERCGGEGSQEPEAQTQETGYPADADGSGVGGDLDGARLRMPLLRGERRTNDSGSRHPDQQGWGSLARERGAGVPPMQQSKEGQATGANLRNFWLLGPEPSREAHYAAFPTEIPRRCILAGTSQAGACPACGSPLVRVVEREKYGDWSDSDAQKRLGIGQRQDANDFKGANYYKNYQPPTQLGWAASCACVDAGPPVPQTVLDPFLGSGTTALVADRLGRDAIGIELSPAYAEMAKTRIEGDEMLFSDPVQVLEQAEQLSLMEAF